MKNEEIFEDLIRLGAYLVSLYFGGWVSKLVGFPALLGEIIAGVLMGPEVGEILSTTKSDFVVLMGNFGITMMIFESGMHVHFDKITQVIGKSFVISVLSSLIPVAAAMLFVYLAYGDDSDPTVIGAPTDCEGSGSSLNCDNAQSVFPDGFSMGCALAPTSVAIVSKILTETKLIDTTLGQRIKLAACFVEDVFSITALIVLTKVAEGDTSGAALGPPIVYLSLFLAVGSAIGLFLFPPAVGYLVENIPRWVAKGDFSRSLSQLKSRLVYRDLSSHYMVEKGDSEIRGDGDTILLILMAGCLVLYAYLSSHLDTHLLGAFVAGVSFSRVPRGHLVWVMSSKHVTRWLLRFFFGGTVAFAIPVDGIFKWRAFYLGLLAAIGPCFLAKMLSGIVDHQNMLTIGAAMSARAEFSFLIAQEARSMDYKSGAPPYGKMMSLEVFSITVWALLLGTVLPPWVLVASIRRLKAKETVRKVAKGGLCAFTFKMKVFGEMSENIIYDVIEMLKSLNLHAESINLDTDGSTFILTASVGTNTKTLYDDLTDDAVHSIRHHFHEILPTSFIDLQLTPPNRRAQIGKIFFYDGGNHKHSLATATATTTVGDVGSDDVTKGPSGLISEDPDHKWMDSAETEAGVIVKFRTPIYISRYAFRTAGDFSDNGIEPISWTLEGCTDIRSDNWVPLDEVTSFKTPSARLQTIPHQKITNPGVYKKIRFTPTEIPLHNFQKDERAFRPGIRLSKELSCKFYVVVKTMGIHSFEFVNQIYTILSILKLDVRKAKMYQARTAGQAELVSIKYLYCTDTTCDFPGDDRLAEIRQRLRSQFSIFSVNGKAMVTRIRQENSPKIVGYTPDTRDGEHVGEFILVYKHPREERKKKKPNPNEIIWCPLSEVLTAMHGEFNLHVNNLAMDVDDETGYDQVSIFVKDPDCDHQDDDVIQGLLQIFKSRDVPCFISGHLHQWDSAEQQRAVQRLGQAGDKPFGGTLKRSHSLHRMSLNSNTFRRVSNFTREMSQHSPVNRLPSLTLDAAIANPNPPDNAPEVSDQNIRSALNTLTERLSDHFREATQEIDALQHQKQLSPRMKKNSVKWASE
eukprot:TRINITY_DN2632_c1_g1_i1.p1 TRINITY_DN2632_c1_g1~~TRINITY_DN2632_c1_g1_i1.p1  ORF type:complete len:1083 (+),score=147.76 TRINITY_DN2632_c1_g1_i1:33-3281(+)